MPFIAKGRHGSLRVGGREAAQLLEWTFTPGEPRWSVRADLGTYDDYWLASNGPFELRLPLAQSTWRWRNVAVSREYKTLAITGEGEPESL